MARFRTARHPLLLLEPLASEFQRPAVLGDGSHDVIRGAGRNLGLYLKRDRHRRVDQTGEMRDHLIVLDLLR